MSRAKAGPTATRLRVAAQIAAVLPALAGLTVATMTPATRLAAHGIPLSAVPVALTSTVDISGAEAFLYNPEDPTGPNAMADSPLITAYGDLNAMAGDSGDTFSNTPGYDIALNFHLLTDLSSIGQLTEDGIQNETSVLSTAGDFTAAPDLPTADAYVNVNDDANASQYFTGAVEEANIETQSLKNLGDLVQAHAATSGLGLTYAQEFPMTGDLLAFQEQINGSLNSLNQALPSLDGYETNGILEGTLKGMLTSELDLNTIAGDMAGQLAAGNVNGLAAVNADLVANGLGEYGYMQATLGFFSFQNAISDAEGWFNSLL